MEVFTTANAVWRNREPLIKLHCDNMELLHLMQEAEPCDESGSETRSIAHQVRILFSVHQMCRSMNFLILGGKPYLRAGKQLWVCEDLAAE